MLALGRLRANDEGVEMPSVDEVPTPMPMLVAVVELVPPPPRPLLVIPAAPEAARSQNGEHWTSLDRSDSRSAAVDAADDCGLVEAICGTDKLTAAGTVT